MSFDYENDGNDQEQDGPKALREALAKANKALEAASKQNSELQTSLNEIKLGQVFTDKKVPAALQRLMKAEKVEASPEAVDKWLTDNGSDFGWAPQAASTETPEGSQVTPQEAPAVQSVLTPEDIAALQRVQQLSAAGSGQFTVSDQAEQAVQTAASAAGLTGGPDDFDKLMAAFRQQGIPIESSFG